MDTDAVLRSATASDVPSIETIVADAYSPYIARIGRQPAPMTVDYAALVAEGDSVAVLTAPSSGDPIGIIVTRLREDHLLVENMAVSPQAQGKGYGRVLLNFADRRARESQLNEIRLYTNAAMVENLAFYSEQGYTQVDRRVEDGFDRVYFAKTCT